MDVTLCDNIHWVGYVDWAVRDFHGYHTSRGSTYNAYLVVDEKTALVDTVKAPFAEQFLLRVSDIHPLDKIDYIICNHAEPDHSGSLPITVEACPNAKVVCNAKCRDALSLHFDTAEWDFEIVEDGQTISLGKRSFTFINTPMAHWPESMFTYVPEEKLLFSMDAFGQHYASSWRFDDQAPMEEVMQEAKTYYANILMPYGKQVAGVMKKAAGIEMDIVAPSHGIIWRKHFNQIVEAYQDWTTMKAKPKLLILYDSMWGSTNTMAEVIEEAAMAEDLEVKRISIRTSDITRMATEVLDAAAIAFGTPTLNRTMMPQMGALLTYLKGLRPTGKAAFSFGSYGWAKGGAKDMDAFLEDLKFDIILDEPIQSKFRPDEMILDECRAAARKLADKAREIAGK